MKKLFLTLLLSTLISVTFGQTSSMKTISFRLKPGDDLREGIEKVVQQQKIQAGTLLSAVGSLTTASIRFANQPEATTLNGHFEIVSITGTVSTNGSHIHISVSNETGKTVGGHLAAGNKIYTTAEIIMGILPDLSFQREVDPTFGYKELVIKPAKGN